MKFRNSWYILAIVYVFFTLISCAPIKRHQRLVEKYPFVHTVDTVTIIDTFRFEVPKIEVDTIFSTSLLHDTVTIIKDRLKIQMYKIHDSIYLSGECDTITVEKIVIQKVPVKYFEKKTTFQTYFGWALIGLFLLILFYIFTKNRKNELD